MTCRPASMKAYTAKRKKSARIVTPGQATTVTPTAIARMRAASGCGQGSPHEWFLLLRVSVLPGHRASQLAVPVPSDPVKRWARAQRTR
jgi:hypothetical protein